MVPLQPEELLIYVCLRLLFPETAMLNVILWRIWSNCKCSFLMFNIELKICDLYIITSTELGIIWCRM